MAENKAPAVSDYDSAVFGLTKFINRVDKFWVQLDPKQWRPTPQEIVIKEEKLNQLKMITMDEKVTSACVSHKDAKKVMDKHQKELDDCEEKLEKCQLVILELQEKKEESKSKHKPPTPTDPQPPPTPTDPQLPPAPKVHAFKLEKIKLPVFGGDFGEWQEFHDLFLSAVHNNPHLSGSEKMVYLKSSLKDEAKSIVSSFPSTEKSYVEAWKLVETRFSNQREIVFAHLRKFYILKKQTDTAIGLRKVCDTVNECIRSLTCLGIDVSTWHVILVFWALTKLEEETKKQWLLVQGNELPNITELLQFLEKRATALVETIKTRATSNQSSASSHHTSADGKPKYPCPNCGANHILFYCSSFKSLSLQEKEKLVQRKKLCRNCLVGGHQEKDCPKPFKCKTCGERHSILLHKDGNSAFFSQSRSQNQNGRAQENSGNSNPQPHVVPTSTPNENSVVSNHASSPFPNNSVVLMATLIVDILDSNGDKQQCRVFLDPGSEANFVSENLVERLRLPRQKTCVKVNGIGGSIGDTARGIVSFHAHSRFSNFKLPVKALILKKLTGQLPKVKCQVDFPHLVGLSLSDFDFNSPAPVDILLGAEAASQIIISGLRKGPPGTPLAQNSKFGWFLTGSSPPANSSEISNFTVSVCHSTCSMDDQCLESSLQRFWELEDPSPSQQLSPENQLAEEHFLFTHSRDPDGRFIVQLPFSPEKTALGESKQRAIHCFKSLEKQFQRNPEMKDAYHTQIQEQLNQKWMEAVPESEVSLDQFNSITSSQGQIHSLSPYYMPHHVVSKLESTTTKHRIVFNASAKTSSGNSLNSLLLSGPKIQTDLHPLLIRFRSHPIALAADIVKFYHQIKLHPSHTDFQRLVWRKRPEDPFKDLRFTRVTFGVTTAPFLAIRCLRQLGEENMEKFPLAHHSIQNDFLVDNLLSGADTMEGVLKVKREITEVLKKGQFPLQKWASNHPEVLSSIPQSERESYSLNICEDESIKTIGLFWHPSSDTFGVKIIPPPVSLTTTKRQLLSFTARVFDPLQWLAPVTIKPKILLQSLWKEKLGWDEPITAHYVKKWNKYHQELELLKEFRITRCITFPPNISSHFP